MHSYLIISQDQSLIQNEINRLINRKKLKSYPFQIKSISDVRDLNTFLKLNISKPTGVIIKEIDQATDEAANAFLKNLEEPQKNITFILSAFSTYKILPTIISRCQIINFYISKKISSTKMLKKFLSESTPEKLRHISTIKGRSDALSFIKELTYQAHASIHLNKSHYKKASLYQERRRPTESDSLDEADTNSPRGSAYKTKQRTTGYARWYLFMKSSQSTYDALDANGNVNLQLTNFVVNLE